MDYAIGLPSRLNVAFSGRSWGFCGCPAEACASRGSWRVEEFTRLRAETPKLFRL
jgi:hypothetical protein